MTSRRGARVELMLAALFWSASGVFVKSLPSVHWLVIAGLRSLFGSVVFLPGLAQERPPPGKLLAAILLYALLVSSLMGSMQLGTAAQGIWLQYIAPAVVGLVVWKFQGQRPRPAEAAALALTVAAIALIVAGGSGPAHRHSLLLGLISGVGFGLFIVLLKSLGDIRPAGIYLWTNLGTAAMLLPLVIALGIRLPSSSRDLGLLAAMGIGQLSLPYYLFQRGLARARPVEAALIVLLEPILNPIWVYLAVGEVPSGRVIAGCVLIGLGLVAFALAPTSDGPPGQRR